MKASLKSFLLLFVVSSTLASKEQPIVADANWSLEEIPSSNPPSPLLEDYRQSIVALYKQRDNLVPEFLPWRELSSEDLSSVFPRRKFFLIEWNERISPRADPNIETLSCRFGVRRILSSQDSDKEEWFFATSGNNEKFGELLERDSIRIKNEAEAGKIWLAYRALHQKWNGSRLHRKISDTEWHLGVTVPDSEKGTEYFYQVLTDDKGVVQSARLQSTKPSTAH